MWHKGRGSARGSTPSLAPETESNRVDTKRGSTKTVLNTKALMKVQSFIARFSDTTPPSSPLPPALSSHLSHTPRRHHQSCRLGSCSDSRRGSAPSPQEACAHHVDFFLRVPPKTERGSKHSNTAQPRFLRFLLTITRSSFSVSSVSYDNTANFALNIRFLYITARFYVRLLFSAPSFLMMIQRFTPVLSAPNDITVIVASSTISRFFCQRLFCDKTEFYLSDSAVSYYMTTRCSLLVCSGSCALPYRIAPRLCPCIPLL